MPPMLLGGITDAMPEWSLQLVNGISLSSEMG